jgi:hypothetical protein
MPDGVALRRTGYPVLAQTAPYSVQPTVSAKELFNALDELHAIGDHGKVYVSSFPYIYPGTAYFLADLMPAPVSTDYFTMLISDQDRARFVEHFWTIADQVDYIVTTDRKIPEVDAFLAVHPGATFIRRTLSDHPYFIFGVFPNALAP